MNEIYQTELSELIELDGWSFDGKKCTNSDLKISFKAIPTRTSLYLSALEPKPEKTQNNTSVFDCLMPDSASIDGEYLNIIGYISEELTPIFWELYHAQEPPIESIKLTAMRDKVKLKKNG